MLERSSISLITLFTYKLIFIYFILLLYLIYNFFLVDIGDIDSVFHEYDSNMSQNVITENLFGLLDASSLLWRLEVSGVNVGEERWSKVYKAISEHAHNHRSPW